MPLVQNKVTLTFDRTILIILGLSVYGPRLQDVSIRIVYGVQGDTMFPSRSAFSHGQSPPSVFEAGVKYKLTIPTSCAGDLPSYLNYSQPPGSLTFMPAGSPFHARLASDPTPSVRPVGNQCAPRKRLCSGASLNGLHWARTTGHGRPALASQ
jgi:hypothetical protein